MNYYFLDSSALAKRYLTEKGSKWINALVSPQVGNKLLISQITPVEIMSAVSRQEREGVVPNRTVKAIHLWLNRHITRHYDVTSLSEPIIQQAIDLLRRHPLRAYDAIQLASCIEVSVRLTTFGLPTPTFLSGDKRLLNVAINESLLVDDPNQY